MVTILLATLNGEDYLKAQLESIAAQTYENWQLVVGDDGSTDGTISILEEFSKQYPEQVTIIKNDPPQGSAKDNFISLIQNSYGPYFMFCDQDDVWKKNKMREIERVLSDITEDGSVRGKIWRENTDLGSFRSVSCRS